VELVAILALADGHVLALGPALALAPDAADAPAGAAAAAAAAAGAAAAAAALASVIGSDVTVLSHPGPKAATYAVVAAVGVVPAWCESQWFADQLFLAQVFAFRVDLNQLRIEAQSTCLHPSLAGQLRRRNNLAKTHVELLEQKPFGYLAMFAVPAFQLLVPETKMWKSYHRNRNLPDGLPDEALPVHAHRCTHYCCTLLTRS